MSRTRAGSQTDRQTSTVSLIKTSNPTELTRLEINKYCVGITMMYNLLKKVM